MYKEWADGQVNKIKTILNAAREDHTTAVKSRIDNVKQLGSVIDVTKQLFEVSKVGHGNEVRCRYNALTSARKPRISRRKRSSLSKGLNWYNRRSKCWILGFAMRDRSNKGSNENLPKLSLGRLQKNSKIQKSCSKFYSRAWPTWRVSRVLLQNSIPTRNNY